MWNLILGPIIKGVTGFFKDKAKLKQAKLEGEIAVLKSAAQNISDWEKVMAGASKDSWKDEFWTVLWSIPLILGFVGYADIAQEGFVALAAMPDWYQYTLVTMVLASFGIRMNNLIRSKL
jgi:hypothetical protein